MKFSLIAPTFKRAEEVIEFLQSLLQQDYRDFEVILGDGTPGDLLRPQLVDFLHNKSYPLHIVYEEFLPVSDARNRAAALARGEYLIFLDSDCIIPADYLLKVEAALQRRPLDVFGGPDVAHREFTVLQKAISYSMTSLLTTGGIRGGKRSVGVFHPRGFNMGMKKTAFEAVNGYSEFRCGEDIELSIRLLKAGYKVGLIPEAFVYHKRRTTLSQFFKQVFRFGAARINIWKRHPEELRLTHLFPLFFCVFCVFALSAPIVQWPPAWAALFLLCLYTLALFLHSSIINRSLVVGFYSVGSSFVMLFGYGWGFLKNFWATVIAGKEGGLKL